LLDDVTDGVFSGFILRGRPKTDELDIEYCKYCFQTAHVRKEIVGNCTYTTRALTNGKQLSKISIPVPPRREQQAIAKALSDTDDYISELERLIVKKRDIKQGARQELLQFRDEWEEIELGQVLSYEQPQAYIVSSTDYDTSGIPVLTAGKTFILGYTRDTHGIFDKTPTIIFDDFLTISRYIDFPFKVKSSAIKMLSLKRPQDNLKIIFEIMQILKFEVVDHKRHWISQFSKLKIKLPNSTEQQEIAAILSDMDLEIELLSLKLNKAKLIKQGMMELLLSGKIRLEVENNA